MSHIYLYKLIIFLIFYFFSARPENINTENPVQEIARKNQVVEPVKIDPFTLKYDSFAALEIAENLMNYPIDINLNLQTLIGNGHIFYLREDSFRF